MHKTDEHLLAKNYDPSDRSSLGFELDWQKLSAEWKLVQKDVEEREKALGKAISAGAAPRSAGSNSFEILQGHYQEPSLGFMRKVPNGKRKQHVQELVREINKCRKKIEKLKHEEKVSEEKLKEGKMRESKSDVGGEAGEGVEGSEAEWTTVSKKS
ncbi:MAG: hypothetical protein Q9191_002737 [Dirinaria sp. TL-2023a]